MTMPLRAATYARYSSDLQRPASIDDQVRRYRQELERRGWTDERVFSDSEIPGMVSQGRPGYQEMLKAAKAREFDVLVVDELSRLTRRSSELQALFDRLQFWGIGLVSLLEGLDSLTSPEAARGTIVLKAYTNDNEGRTNAHRSRRGLEGRVRAGQHAGGAIYGYRTRVVRADKPGDPPGTGPVVGYEYVIHPEEAETVQRIFRLYAEGMSPRRIAALLNAEGIPPPGARWRNRLGARRTWAHSAIAGDRRIGTGILNQCKYDGRLIWNRSTWPRDPDRDGLQVRRDLPEDKWVVVDAPHLRIVPHEVWATAKTRQEQRAREGTQSAAHWRNQRLLSGLLVCARCGATFVLRGRDTYACSSRQNRGAAVCDCMVTVSAAIAGKAVLDELQDLFRTDGFLDRLVQEVQQRWREARAAHTQHQTSLHALGGQLNRVEGEIQNLMKAITRGILVEDLAEEMRAAEARRDRLRREIAAAEGANLPDALLVLPSTVRKIVSDLPGMLAAGQMDYVKSTLKRLVGKIEVCGEELPGRKRPGAVLVLSGYMDAVLRLAEQKVKGGHSPGGILPPLRFQCPPRKIRLYLLPRSSGCQPDQPGRVASRA
jgi:site-specific DNA recombinase